MSSLRSTAFGSETVYNTSVLQNNFYFSRKLVDVEAHFRRVILSRALVFFRVCVGRSRVWELSAFFFTTAFAGFYDPFIAQTENFHRFCVGQCLQVWISQIECRVKAYRECYDVISE